MPSPFEHVRPGDVISAQHFNLLLDTLAEMRTRIEQLEAGAGAGVGGVRITGFDPPDQQEVGRNLAILGEGFVTPARDGATGAVRNIIRINGAAIPADHYVITGVGTSARRLELRVPSSLDTPQQPLGSGGRVFEVTVDNEVGRASRSYRLVSFTGNPGTPSPTVTSVVGTRTGNSTVIIGEAARITGTNFVNGSTTVELIFVVGGNQVVVPAPGAAPIAVRFTSATQLEFDVPDPGGRVNIPQGNDVQADVRVTVQGAPNAAVFSSVFVLRI